MRFVNQIVFFLRHGRVVNLRTRANAFFTPAICPRSPETYFSGAELGTSPEASWERCLLLSCPSVLVVQLASWQSGLVGVFTSIFGLQDSAGDIGCPKQPDKQMWPKILCKNIIARCSQSTLQDSIPKTSVGAAAPPDVYREHLKSLGLWLCLVARPQGEQLGSCDTCKLSIFAKCSRAAFPRGDWLPRCILDPISWAMGSEQIIPNRATEPT